MSQQLKELISSPKKIVITTHRGPDGDAMGSSLGLFHLLKQLGHTVNVITPNEYASFLQMHASNCREKAVADDSSGKPPLKEATQKE